MSINVTHLLKSEQKSFYIYLQEISLHWFLKCSYFYFVKGVEYS